MTTNKSAPFSGRSENLYNLQFWFFGPSSEGLKRYVADSSDFEEFRPLTAWAKLEDFADIIRALKMKIKIASYSVFREVGSEGRNRPEKGFFKKQVYRPCGMDYACSMKIKIHSIQNLSREVSPRDAADRANQNQGETKMKKEAMKPARVQPLAKYSDQELRRIARDTLRHSLQMKGKEMDLVEADIVALTEKGRTYRCGKQNYSYADFDGHDLAMYTIYHEGSEGAEKHLRSVRDAAKERVRKLEEKIFREDEIVRWFSTAIRQHKALLRSIGAIR